MSIRLNIERIDGNTVVDLFARVHALPQPAESFNRLLDSGGVVRRLGAPDLSDSHGTTHVSWRRSDCDRLEVSARSRRFALAD